ncbi:MAG: transposase [Planctomycetia bacterium]|nr:transposase [Planctomycetia bacterium]
MSTAAIFQRFMEQSPVTVMVRSTLERAFSAENLDAIFAGAAVRQHPSELLFSSTVDLLAMVVWRQRDSIGQAYRCAKEQFSVSVRSIYNKLNGTETSVCRELVRRTAQPLVEVVDLLRVGRKPQLGGYRTRIIDGNHLAATDHRLKVLRRTKSGPLPGQALAVLDADRMLIADLFPCEDGHAQERRLLQEVIDSSLEGDLWVADRNFCTTGFLFGLAEHRACFVIRQHGSTLSWDNETKRQKVGRCETGVIYEQTLRLTDGDKTLTVRRITIVLNQPTREGETEINILTNLPRSAANAYRVAELYLKRWTIENAFQELEQSLRSEINTLGYPGAALLGFAIAAVTYNALSVAKWAIEKEHAASIAREELSGYYLAAVVSQDYGGMMIALPPEYWTKRFGQLTPRQFAAHLRACAKHARPDAFKKN